MNQDYFVLIEYLRGQVSDISYIMLAAARDLALSTDRQVVAVLLGHNAQDLARTLKADCVLSIDHPALVDFTPDAYQQVLSNMIEEYKPRAFLFGHTTIGMDIASFLSARLDLPIISQCQMIQAENGTLRFTSQICGGKIMAEGELPEPIALVTFVPGQFKAEEGQSSRPPQVTQLPAPDLVSLGMNLKGYIEPATGDVDISKESILVAVGRGIQNQDNIELAEDLAEQLGGVVCASRPVIDQTWLPPTRLVGKSGSQVKPRVYLALGISGAPEHVEGISESEVIIAINTDPGAPIFNVAKYGATVDLFDLVPVLTEKIREARLR